MTAPSPRRVGVLGAGWGTRVSVPAFRAAGWEVVGLWSRRPERAREEAERLEIPLATSDPAVLFDHPEIDAVAIHTPPATHLDLCRQAFSAGKHVLCDKPFTANAADARELQSLAEASGLVAMINFEFRFAPLRLQIKELLDDGAIAAVEHAEVVLHTDNPILQLGRAWRLDPAQGGGVLNELGSHFIDWLRQWFGELDTVSATLASFPPADADADLQTEDTLNASFTFREGSTVRDGAVATLLMSWVSDPPTGIYLTITGTEGVIRARAPGMMLTDGELEMGARGAESLEPVPAPAAPDFVNVNSAVAASRRLINAFEQGIEDRASPMPNFDDALHSQLAIEAIRESAATGRRVTIAR